MQDSINKEVLHALATSSEKTKMSIAAVEHLYLRQHDDGKYYIQVAAQVGDGKELPGYLPYGFTEKEYALEFQKKCVQWVAKKN